MKTQVAAALSMLIGVGLGAAGVQALQAQPKPPVYVVENNQVTNAEGYFKEFLPLSRPTGRAYGGRAIAGGKGIAIEGAPPNNRVVILRFDSLDRAMAWHRSAEYQKARKIGNKYAIFNSFAVQGVPQ